MKIAEIVNMKGNYSVHFGADTVKNLNFIISEKPDPRFYLYTDIVRWFFKEDSNVEIKMSKDETIDGDFIFIDHGIFTRFLSRGSELREQFDGACKKISASRSQKEMMMVSAQINDHVRKILPEFQIDLTLDGHTIQYPEHLSTLEASVLICSILSFIKICLGTDIVLLLIGRWFDELDKKVRYEICRLFSEYLDQVIIFTSKTVLETPIECGSDYKSLYENLKYENIGLVYEFKKNVFSRYVQN